jgi:hypothetical protein
MAANQRKPKSSKQGASASNLLASMPWLKNKTFLIPALASVIVVSLVGVVLAVQVTNSPPADQESAEVSLEESNPEAEEQPAIGFSCVKGTVVCEEVKSILLDTDYEEVLTKWTRQSLIQHLVDTQYVSVKFATEVVDAVKFDWGDGSTYAGGSGSESSTGASSGNSRTSGIGGACVRGKVICEAAIYVLIESDQGKGFTRENFIEVWMSEYGATRVEVEGIISAIGFTNWARSSGTTALPPALLPEVPVSPTAGLTPDQGQTATYRANEILNLWGESYGPSRLRVIDDIVRLFGFGIEESTEAVDSLNADWNTQAFKAARNLAKQAGLSKFSKKGIENLLVERKFTQAEAEYAMNTLDYNWLGNAVRAADRKSVV